MHLAHYLQLLCSVEGDLAAALRTVADAHADEPEISHAARLCAGWCDRHVTALDPFCSRYAAGAREPPEALHVALFHGPRTGGLGVLRDLHDVFLLASSADITWTLVSQAARGARDEALIAAAADCDGETARILTWLRTAMKTAAPQALVVA